MPGRDPAADAHTIAAATVAELPNVSLDGIRRMLAILGADPAHSDDDVAKVRAELAKLADMLALALHRSTAVSWGWTRPGGPAVNLAPAEAGCRTSDDPELLTAAGSPPPAQDSQESASATTRNAKPDPQAPQDTTVVHAARQDREGDVWVQLQSDGPWQCGGLREPTREGLEYTWGPTRPVCMIDDRTQAIVDATIAWRNAAGHHFDAWADDSDKALVAAVDQHQDTQYVALCEGTQA